LFWGEEIMRWRAKAIALGAAVVFGAVGCGSAFAGAAAPVVFTVDEHCLGSFVVPNPAGPPAPPLSQGTVPCGVGQDPVSGLSTVIYDLFAPPLLPFGSSIMPGDLVLTEPGTGAVSDVIRFLPSAAGLDGGGISAFLVFYSDNSDGVADALADVGIPAGRLSPVLTLPEVGPEGSNGITYIPLPGQPGSLNNFPSGFATYIIRSDAPEPATLALLGIGLAGLALSRRGRRR
jgi:hypothetical protein